MQAVLNVCSEIVEQGIGRVLLSEEFSAFCVEAFECRGVASVGCVIDA